MTDASPLPLPPNVFDHFYLGGERIAALRGLPHRRRADQATRGVARLDRGPLGNGRARDQRPRRRALGARPHRRRSGCLARSRSRRPLGNLAGAARQAARRRPTPAGPRPPDEGLRRPAPRLPVRQERSVGGDRHPDRRRHRLRRRQPPRVARRVGRAGRRPGHVGDARPAQSADRASGRRRVRSRRHAARDRRRAVPRRAPGTDGLLDPPRVARFRPRRAGRRARRSRLRRRARRRPPRRLRCRDGRPGRPPGRRRPTPPGPAGRRRAVLPRLVGVDLRRLGHGAGVVRRGRRARRRRDARLVRRPAPDRRAATPSSCRTPPAS